MLSKFLFGAVLVLGLIFAASPANAQLAKVTGAAAACPDDSGNRFVDCGNGTVTDSQTGLVWLQDASCYGGVPSLEWFEAMALVAGLSSGDCGLSDGSAPGDWRLPTKEEWEAMIVDVPVTCDPRIFDDAGVDCWIEGVDSFVGIVSERYWSSTTLVAILDRVWFADLVLGTVDSGNKAATLLVWPVRDSQ